MIENCIKILNIENHLNNDKNVNKEPLEFELTSHIIHSTDDSLVK